MARIGSFSGQVPTGAGNAVTVGQPDRPVGLSDNVAGSVWSDQAGNLYIEQSGNGTNWDVRDTQAIIASTGTNPGAKFSQPIVLPFIRVRFENTGGATANVRIFVTRTAAGED